MKFLNKTLLFVTAGLIFLGFSFLISSNKIVENKQSNDERVEKLLRQMTIDEKIGQLVLVDKNAIQEIDDITHYGVGGLLSGGGDKPEANTPAGWLQMVRQFQDAAQKSRLKIPLLYGVDAVHGHANVPGATIFPHEIGLAATHDADLVRKIGAITADELVATGIQWNFAPGLDVAEDVRWGRVYETFGSSSTVVSDLGAAYIEGLQSGSGKAHVIATAKHYLGTGAMEWGSSTNSQFKIDQGATLVDEKTLRAKHLPPFIAAINAGVESVMVGHTSWQGTEIVGSRYLITDVLKHELAFKGFVVSDWAGIYEIPGGEYHAVVTSINAGVDMVMLPTDYKNFIENMQRAMAQGDVSQERLDDAVRRILTAKFKVGLFERVVGGAPSLTTVGSQEHREVAREAVRKSLVLLKNSHESLPLSKNAAHIIVAGSAANNIGKQSGGWTVEWQGIDGNWIPGTTILDGIKNAVARNTRIDYSEPGEFSGEQKLADVGVAVVGESPYAEGFGDSDHPMLTKEDLETVARVRAASKKMVVVIVSGRPLDIRADADNWDAIVAAWLPGSEGEGVADMLFGDYPFMGTLPIEWSVKK
jgi:beta-glucosidase